MPASGRLISIEGIDGAGKSLQTRLLAENLRAAGVDAVTTFEPGGGDGGHVLRQLLTGHSAGRWGTETEALLFTAARRNHLDTFILPALRRGRTVITDRFADSTRIYQGFADPELRRKIDRLHDLMIGFEPELTVIIDIPVETALARVRGRSGGDSRLEAFGVRLEELRQSFVSHGNDHPCRCRIVDGSRSSGEIADEIFQLACRILP